MYARGIRSSALVAFPFCVALAPWSQQTSFAPTTTGPAAAAPAPAFEVQAISEGAWEPHLGARLVPFLRFEENDGVDHNGDGDFVDHALHIFVRATGAVLNLGLAVPAIDGRGPLFEVTGDRLFVWVAEWDQGGVDLNGDGDATDAVLHVYDHETGLTVNSALAGDGSWVGFQVEGELATFFVIEDAQGIDLNGDGDTNDWVLHFVHLGAGTVTNTRLCSAGNPRVTIDGRHVLVRVDEECWGPAGLDLNADGDTADAALVDYDSISGTYTSPGIAMAPTGWSPRPIADGYLFMADEANQGMDLNADGDMADSVPHYLDRVTGRLFNQGFAMYSYYAFHGDRVVFLLHEADNGGVDFNGDGDYFDEVLYTFEFATGALWNTGLASGYRLHLADGVVAFGVNESAQRVDLSGDGDTSDIVLHPLDLSTGALRNEGLAISLNAFEVRGRRLEVGVSEAGAGQSDWTGDGDADDTVLFVQDPGRGAPAPNAWTTDVTPHQLLGVPEAGDAEGSSLFYVLEADQGATDLNGDGDADDRVLCLGRLR